MGGWAKEAKRDSPHGCHLSRSLPVLRSLKKVAGSMCVRFSRIQKVSITVSLKKRQLK